MEAVNEKIEQQAERIKQNLVEIKEGLNKTNSTFFIELVGTPKSGKTTLLAGLKNLLSKYEVPFETKRETAEYNPIQNKGTEEYTIWMLMELMKNLSEDFSNKTPRLIIYDRGLLDRIPWFDFHSQRGEVPMKDMALLKQLYQTEFMQKYRPLSYCFITSPELSVRRKGKPGRLVNVESVQALNGYFEKEHDLLESISDQYSVISTDSYQGKLEMFMMDITEKITNDVLERIRQMELEQVERKVEGER